MIYINARYQGLIGDALCAVPYMQFLCGRHGATAWVTGFNGPTRGLLRDYPFIFAENLPAKAVEARYELDLHAAWTKTMRGGWQLHMAQMYFDFYNCPVPQMPLCFPMTALPTTLLPGIVLTPYSRTNMPDNNKFWPHARWLTVLRRLLDSRAVDHAYVVGGAEDDMSPYQNQPGITILQNRPLGEILTLLRESPLVLGLDNGISHLAHFGGVDRHIMIYADCLPPKLAENPHGVHLRAPMPINIQTHDVIAVAEQILERARVPA